MLHGARYLAKLHYADQLAQDLDDMAQHVKADAQDAVTSRSRRSSCICLGGAGPAPQPDR
jgi:hypothetical protein